ncbi:hypothetical protein [Streptomyces erythrochromogenes]|uniref:hypothetical protein n=1 Tax=Streptomyces erythrochromogenes TaxID=285574 RepID=UPI00340F76DB
MAGQAGTRPNAPGASQQRIRGGTGMFGPAKQVSGDAPALDRIAAYFGRTL